MARPDGRNVHQQATWISRRAFLGHYAGSLGGLARATADVVRVLDAAGYGAILIETVGAGQSEVEIARAVQTTVVIEAPGLGDDVQAIKAGLLEAADVLVVNKADQPGADSALKALRASLDLAHPAARRWAQRNSISTYRRPTHKPPAVSCRCSLRR